MGTAISFLVTVWIIISIGAGIYQGSSVATAATVLTSALSDTGTVLNVQSTNGFPSVGKIQIDNETIWYSRKTATTFYGVVIISPVIRGSDSTTATAHSSGAYVRTSQSSMLNNSLGYKLALTSDSSGLMAFVTIPLAFLSFLAGFFSLPIGFLGTDWQILTYLWAALSIGIIVAIGIAMAGGRHV